jgi:AcrR family transcriptional regulator
LRGYTAAITFAAVVDTRRNILEAALEVYSQLGFRGATTRRIADAAGVNEVTVFRHFGSKDALLQEALQLLAEESSDILLPKDPNEPLQELTDWSEAELTRLRARRSMIRTCMGEIGERPQHTVSASAAPRRAFAELSRYLTRLKETGAAAKPFNTDAAAAMLWGSLFADAMGRDMMPEVFPSPPERAPRRYVELLLRALGVDYAETITAVRVSAPPAIPDATGS